KAFDCALRALAYLFDGLALIPAVLLDLATVRNVLHQARVLMLLFLARALPEVAVGREDVLTPGGGRIALLRLACRARGLDGLPSDQPRRWHAVRGLPRLDCVTVLRIHARQLAELATPLRYLGLAGVVLLLG